MTKAPERIWATAYYNQNRSEHVKAWSETGFDDLQQVEYVRADLHREMTVNRAAQVLLDEVLHEASPDAVALRATMFSAIMRHKIPSASAKDRWHMLNHAIQALAGEIGLTPKK
jgi:hypothetical protein